MSKDDCNQRFKGVENFLRRVAFNLGNTPSQTEVKVISCIPIDVTDLQRKIVQLEKQLEQQQEQQLANKDLNCRTKSPNPKETAIVHTAICSCDNKSNAATSCRSIDDRHSSTHSRTPPALNNHNSLSTHQKRSNISFICTTGPQQAPGCFYSTEVSEMTCTKKRKPLECRKIFFHKRKVPKKSKIKTQMVYYARTQENNPFNKFFLANDGTSKSRGNEESNNLNRSYLKDIFHEQYKHGPVHQGINSSEFSTPICRDVTHTTKIVEPHESDMCSCCHGQFQNIDNHMSKNNHFDIFSSQTDSKNAYYDANLYDVVPVKENAMKVMNLEFPKRKEPRHQMDEACWPGNVRLKCKGSPMIVNYSTTPQVRHILRKVPVKHHDRIEKEFKKMARNPTLYCPVNQEIGTKHSNSPSVEIGEVYVKRIGRNGRKISKSKPLKVINHSDAACLTTVITSAECQTISATNASLQGNNNELVLNVAPPEDKTKETLNQIKDILQSVLTEVKTNSKLRNISGQTKKKDAVVQNGPSQSNIYGGSSLLQSFTYSPYNMDPYGHLCSQQRYPPSSLCYPTIPPSTAKCMQHYPLFVQPGRNTCTSCYGNNPQVSKLSTIRRAASTATNTEDLQTRSKETENLIKEIYKAMAFNIEIPTQDSLVNEHGDIHHNNYNTSPEDREAKHIAKAISEIFKNTNPMHSSVTQNTGTPMESKPTSNETSFRFQLVQNNAQSGSKESVDIYSNGVNSESTDNDETKQVSRELESDEESDVTIVNEVTEPSASETESEHVDDDEAIADKEPCKEKEKKGIFRKMLQMFMPRNRKKTKGRKEIKTSEIDSDNYNVHRHSLPPTKPVEKTRNKSRAVVFYSKKPRNQSPAALHRRTPYMEQEYRRYFDEELAFHNGRYTRSSSREFTAQNRPVYYQKVEARSALVDYFNQSDSMLVDSKIERKNLKQYRNENQSDTRVKNDFPEKVSIVPQKATTWLEKHKLGIHCGKQWKKLILDG